MSRNREVAEVLYEIATLLEVQGAPFKPRAYQRAAVNIESSAEDVEKLAADGRLGTIAGVGEAIALKVQEYLADGTLPYLEKLRAEVPPGLLALLAVPGLGPKKAKTLWTTLKIRSLDDLRAAIVSHKVRDQPGFGPKSEADLLKALANASAVQRRFHVGEAKAAADALQRHLEAKAGVRRGVFAGSYRRGRDTVGDLDLLIEAGPSAAKRVVAALASYPDVAAVLEQGPTRARVRLASDLQIDLRVVPKASFGAAMLYFTGSKEHNIALRSLALRRGFTLNEYGLARKKGGARRAGRTEESVYAKLGLEWIPPEMRENRGEIELAAQGKLPSLVVHRDVRGDLHTHTTESDGAHGLPAMLRAAEKRGYAYIGISDHSVGLRVANGLGVSRYERQRREIRKAQDAYPRMRILQGSELEIHKDGSLDLTAAARRDLDYVVGAVHSSFDLPRADQTRRVLEAMDAGIDVLAHPTCRRIGSRAPIELDLDAVADKARERGVLLEIDGIPERLDLSGDAVQACRTRGARFVVTSDAHSVAELEFVSWAVAQARRGWLTKRDVANAQPLTALERHLGHARRA